MRRHPTKLALGAWFDGEGYDSVGWHVASCERCRRTIERFERVRVATRDETVPAPVAPRRRLVHTALVAAAVAAFGIAAIAHSSVLPGPLQDIPSLFSGPDEPTNHVATGVRHHTTKAPAVKTTTKAAPAPVSSKGAATVKVPKTNSGVAPVTTKPAAPPAIQLGVVVPVDGPGAQEGHAVVEAVRTAVKDAGNLGRKVRVVVVPAGDANPPGDGDERFLVGGFGDAPASSGWLIPADPGTDGASVVSGELDARTAGARLAQDLVSRGFKGTVGVIVGDGPDAALATGIATVTKVQKVQADASSPCAQHVLDLRLAGVVALAVAGSPDLQNHCAAAAAEQGWTPDGGILLPPSAAYADLQHSPWIHGARTVLGFSWPTAHDPGAAWFRRSVQGTTSYRALVSFAAADLAIRVIRAEGDLSTQLVRDGTWRSALYTFSHGVNENERVVVAAADGWFSVNADGSSNRPEDPSSSATGGLPGT